MKDILKTIITVVVINILLLAAAFGIFSQCNKKTPLPDYKTLYETERQTKIELEKNTRYEIAQLQFEKEYLENTTKEKIIYKTKYLDYEAKKNVGDSTYLSDCDSILQSCDDYVVALENELVNCEQQNKLYKQLDKLKQTDSLFYATKISEQSQIITNLQKPNFWKNRFVFGVGAGGGYGVINKKFDVYVGVWGGIRIF